MFNLSKIRRYDLILASLGVIVSTYLFFLKVIDVPCSLGASCSTILDSRYSEVFGLPVSIFSIILWSVFALNNGIFRLISSVLLVLGSLVFTSLQVFVLPGFCPYCLVHAILSFFVVLFLSEHAPKEITYERVLGRYMLINSVPVAFILLLPNLVSDEVEEISLVPLVSNNPGVVELKHSPLRIYPSHRLNRNILVVSPSCPGCLETLASFDLFIKENPDAPVPELIWDTMESEEIVSYVVSYIKSNPSDLQPIVRWLKSIDRSRFEGDELKSFFEVSFPDLAIDVDNREVLDAYTTWLKSNPLKSVPTLISHDGFMTSQFSTNEIINDTFIQAKLEVTQQNIDLGIRSPGEVIDFDFTVRNVGNKACILEKQSISSLPFGEISWSENSVKPNEIVRATVSWKVPDDYNGEAFARVYYEANSVSISLPVELRVPKKGWVWPTINSYFSDLDDVTFRIRNIDNPLLTISSATCDIPDVQLSVDKEGNIHFQNQDSSTFKLEDSKEYKIYLEASDGYKFDMPLTLHPDEVEDVS